MAAQWIGGGPGLEPRAQQPMKQKPVSVTRVGRMFESMEVGVAMSTAGIGYRTPDSHSEPVTQCPGCGARQIAWIGGGPVCAYCGGGRAGQLVPLARQAIGSTTAPPAGPPLRNTR